MADSNDEVEEKRPVSVRPSIPAGRNMMVEEPIVRLNNIIARYNNLADKKERYKNIISRNINILKGDNDMEYIQFILTNFNNLTDIKERINAIIEQVYPNPGDIARKNDFRNSIENANISVVMMATTLRALTKEMRDELKQLKEIHNDAIKKLRKERRVGGLGSMDSDSDSDSDDDTDARSQRPRRTRPTSTAASSSQSGVRTSTKQTPTDSQQTPKASLTASLASKPPSTASVSAYQPILNPLDSQTRPTSTAASSSQSGVPTSSTLKIAVPDKQSSSPPSDLDKLTSTEAFPALARALDEGPASGSPSADAPSSSQSPVTFTVPNIDDDLLRLRELELDSSVPLFGDSKDLNIKLKEDIDIIFNRIKNDTKIPGLNIKQKNMNSELIKLGQNSNPIIIEAKKNNIIAAYEQKNNITSLFDSKIKTLPEWKKKYLKDISNTEEFYKKYAVDSERINKPSVDTYESKYLKYKNKYLKLKESLL
jgi:hypothetical protein